MRGMASSPAPSLEEDGPGSQAVASSRVPVVRPLARPPDVPKRGFARGKTHPRATAWFGVRSFYGHLWHLVASAIATQDIDSRDWMAPDDPARLTQKLAGVLDKGADSAAGSVTEAIGRDLYIDYVADTGDDADVSARVAELVASIYEVPSPDGGTQRIPRGDLLLFGGDTAYPVATATELEARLIRPWNRVFAERSDGKRRALLGIPGNHDWFDGLDGFARMFRARVGPMEEDREAAAPGAEQPAKHLVRWMEAFAMGKHLVKRRTLPLIDYEPLQRASYFALTLAPDLDLWGADRQLRQVNFQQRRFFAERRRERPHQRLILCLPEPVRAWNEPSPVALEAIAALDVDPKEPLLCLAGDTHHYERWHSGAALHIVAGGGGAFLHGARVQRKRRNVSEVEFPGPRASRALISQVPLRVALGRAGFIPHLSAALLFLPALGLGLGGGGQEEMASVGAAVLGTVVCSLLGGWRRKGFRRIAFLSALTGVFMGLLPVLAGYFFDFAASLGGAHPAAIVRSLALFSIAVFGGAFAFGTYLAALALFGLNHDQAYAALGHPGYKHFVRMRVHADGSAVDLWVIGLEDPLRDREPVLVDAVTFRPARAASSSAAS
jgi:hypothetical protein